MGYDVKYGTVTTEHGNIPVDEPVVVFRARDCLVPTLLAYYAALCRDVGSPERHLQLVGKSAELIEQWQAQHPEQLRIPDSERSRAWLPD
jgi:hypothetical protein